MSVAPGALHQVPPGSQRERGQTQRLSSPGSRMGGRAGELKQAKEERSRSQKGMSAVGDHGCKIMGALFRG